MIGHDSLPQAIDGYGMMLSLPAMRPGDSISVREVVENEAEIRGQAEEWRANMSIDGHVVATSQPGRWISSVEIEFTFHINIGLSKVLPRRVGIQHIYFQDGQWWSSPYTPINWPEDRVVRGVS